MGKTCAFGVTFIDCRDRRPRRSVKPNFKNSNFSKEEFSDTSSVPKTLLILFINGSVELLRSAQRKVCFANV